MKRSYIITHTVKKLYIYHMRNLPQIEGHTEQQQNRDLKCHIITRDPLSQQVPDTVITYTKRPEILVLVLRF